MSRERADAFAASLDIDLDVGICLACLSFVSFAVDGGDPADIAREVRRMTPDLWHDGLAGPVLAAAREARDRGVPDAEAALAELQRRGGTSSVARAIVLRLGKQLCARMHAESRVRVAARTRLHLAPPELN